MSETKYTPGPWSRNIKPASKYSTIFAGRNTHVANLATKGLSEQEIEGNCSLIAAAPDLLAACEAALDFIHTLPYTPSNSAETRLQDKLVDVITKAKGGKP